MAFPKTYTAETAPVEVLSLVHRVMPLLLDGEHPALASLREQYRRAKIGAVELSGAGFFLDFEVPPDAPRAHPANFTGGSALIELAGAPHGAGCALFVRDGVLSMLEGFVYGDGVWSEEAQVLAVSDVTPVDPTGAG